MAETMELPTWTIEPARESALAELERERRERASERAKLAGEGMAGDGENECYTACRQHSSNPCPDEPNMHKFPNMPLSAIHPITACHALNF